MAVYLNRLIFLPFFAFREWQAIMICGVFILTTAFKIQGKQGPDHV